MTMTGFQTITLPKVELSLAAVLKCGQSFRWTTYPLPGHAESQPATEYRLCLRDRVVCLRQNDSTLFYKSVFPDPQPTLTQLAAKNAETLGWLQDYFQLDTDLSKLYQEWAGRDKVFASMQERFGGIRILRQDPWETVICFICSSNNNITRITKMVTALCKEYSPSLLSIEHHTQGTVAYHPFPPPSALASDGVAATLRSLGFGYRAEFIQRTAKMLVDAHGSEIPKDKLVESSEVWLKGLRELPTEQARQELLKFVGVGRKVADCILLMSLDKREVVPVDTHVHQIAIKYYRFKGTPGKMNPQIYESVAAKFTEVWGDYAGWAHSVLFTADLKSFSSYGLSTPTNLTTSTTTTESSPDTSSKAVIGETTLQTTHLTRRRRRNSERVDIDMPRPKRRSKRP